MLNITDVRIRRMDNSGKLKALVSITLDSAIVIHDIKVIEKIRGYLVAMPSRKLGEGDFKDIVHPISSQVRSYLEEFILNKYEAMLLQEDVEQEMEKVSW